VHVGAVALHVEKRRIEPRQPVVIWHAVIFAYGVQAV
jgi:hypothetical protein